MKTEPSKNEKQNSGISNWLRTRAILKAFSTHKYLAFLLRKSKKQKQEQEQIGCESWVTKKPRAWVVRIPGSFVGYCVKEGGGGFQTIVIAEDVEAAWTTAMDTDSWEVLPFDVDGMECFPKDPLTK